jgi:hypothetical protein
MPSYALDPKSARQADNRSRFINEIGAYVGKFVRAEAIEATTGTKGVGLTFVTDSDQRADLTLYTLKSDGTELMGYQTLMAIMTCMSVKELKESQGEVTKWDRDVGAEVTETATLFKELMNKPIGLMLVTREYEKRDGSLGQSMEIAYTFQAGTQFMAAEILDRANKPEKFDLVFKTLKHRPLSNKKKVAAEPTGGSFKNASDDDIPF